MSHPTSSPPTGLALAEFNRTPDERLHGLLSECLHVDRWITGMLAGRPYADRDTLLAAATATAAPLLPAEIRTAMESHPRIGEKATGRSRSAGWSESEQSGVDSSEGTEFASANADYEARFGHVYLVCASGRSGTELLADLRARLANEPGTELAVAGEELLKIAAIRLGKVVPA